MSDANVVPAPVPINPQARALRKFLDTETNLKALTRVLPEGLTADGMIRQTLTLANNNPALFDCDQTSILGGIIQAAELGLQLSGALGQAYLVPRWDQKRGCYRATFQVGYRGLMDLVHRTGACRFFTMREARENDHLKISYGTINELDHQLPKQGDRGEIVGYYSAVGFTNGGKDFEYMTVQDLEEHRRKYAAKNKLWDHEWDAMCLKTTARKLCKRLPMSVKAQRAAILDELHERGVLADVLPDTPLGGAHTEALADTLDALAAPSGEGYTPEVPEPEGGPEDSAFPAPPL